MTYQALTGNINDKSRLYVLPRNKQQVNEYKNSFKQKDVANDQKDIKQKGAVVAVVENEHIETTKKNAKFEESDDRRKRRKLVSDSTEIDSLSNSIPDKSKSDSNVKLNTNLSNLDKQQSNSADSFMVKSTENNVKLENDNALHGKPHEPNSTESAIKSKDNITTTHLELSSGSLEQLVTETISWAAKNNNRELEGLSLALQGLLKIQEAKCKPQWQKLALNLAELLEAYE
ncbi:7544_t:CDS:2 [Ambispora leptoticha]|uniref:7544_t:CDS:1 n=1 Tax=Ambispora leptoticha TaxID=144679 RepID=A0A9N9F6Q9_9GLOM|nr:7544_t:CDS:2 [Ambispora leptoticha]